MTRKRRYLISAAVLAACVGIALAVLAMRPPRPSRHDIAKLFRIEQGMSREEMAAILGEPTGVVGNGALDWQFGDGTRLIVEFDEGKATGAMQMNSPETISDKLRRWLHLPPAE